MTVLFLAIDGVIINRKSSRVRYDSPDPDCVARLNGLIQHSGGTIVVTGAWRIGRSVKELHQLLEQWGVRGEVIAKTPQGSPRSRRGDEIGDFLHTWQHEKIDSFVILDPNADMGEFLPKLIHTRFESGLTENDVEMAIRMLEKL